MLYSLFAIKISKKISKEHVSVQPWVLDRKIDYNEKKAMQTYLKQTVYVGAFKK